MTFIKNAACNSLGVHFFKVAGNDGARRVPDPDPINPRPCLAGGRLKMFHQIYRHFCQTAPMETITGKAEEKAVLTFYRPPDLCFELKDGHAHQIRPNFHEPCDFLERV